MIALRLGSMRDRALAAMFRWRWFLLASTPAVVIDVIRFVETGWVSLSVSMIATFLGAMAAFVLVGRTTPVILLIIAVLIGMLSNPDQPPLNVWNETQSGDVVKTFRPNAGVVVRGVHLGRSAESAWAIPADVDEIVVRVSSVLEQGPVGWDFSGNTASRYIHPVGKGDVQATAFVPPKERGGFILRRFETHETVSSRRFRARVSIASLQGGDVSGVILISEPGGGQPVRLPFSVSGQKSRFDVSWQPAGVTSSTAVDVVIAGVSAPVRVSEVRLVEYDGTSWSLVGLPAPVGVGLHVPRKAGCATQPGDCWLEIGRHVPTRTQATYKYRVPPATFQGERDLRLAVSVERNAVVTLHRVTLVATLADGSQVTLKPVRRLTRQSLGLGHPNVAGDALASTGLFATQLTHNLPAMLGVLVAVAALVVATGSRSALVVLVVVGATIVVTTNGAAFRRRPWRAITGAVLLVSVLVYGIDSVRPGTLVLLGDGSLDWLATRAGAWEKAVLGFTAKPWFGVGADASGYFDGFRFGPRHMTVEHAHNLWLQATLESGILGLLCVGAFALTAILRSLACQEPNRYLVVAAILALQVVDTTILALPVMAALVASIEAPRA